MLTTIAFATSLGFSFNHADAAAATKVTDNMGAGEAEPDEVLRVDISLHESDDYDDEDYDLDYRRCTTCREARMTELEQELARLEKLDPKKKKDHQYEWDWVYFMMGVAPATTFSENSFHPHLRYDMELGLTFWRPKDDRTMTLGVDGHISQFFDRTRPGGGADVVGSAQFGNFYARAGLGVLTGIPYGPESDVFRPAVGGVVGVGATVSDGDFGGRIGVDYDVRVDRGLGLVQTLLLTARFTWGF